MGIAGYVDVALNSIIRVERSVILVEETQDPILTTGPVPNVSSKVNFITPEVVINVGLIKLKVNTD